TQDPFLKKRVFKTLEEGIKKGYKPKTVDLAELVNIHDQYAIKTTENIKLLEMLKKMQDEAGVKLIQRADKAPEDWITEDHPVMRRAIFVPGEPGMLLKAPVKYHPDLEPIMKSVFGKRIKSTPIQIYETVNALLKQTQLGFSLFHHIALTETGVATMGPVQTAKIFGNVPAIWRALKKNQYAVYEEKFEAAKDGIRHGLQVGAITDVQRGLVNDTLEKVENYLNRVHKNLGC
ncbi:unnamed protein product, partial [marine sediment metagenome]